MSGLAVEGGHSAVESVVVPICAFRDENAIICWGYIIEEPEELISKLTMSDAGCICG